MLQMIAIGHQLQIITGQNPFGMCIPSACFIHKTTNVSYLQAVVPKSPIFKPQMKTATSEFTVQYITANVAKTSLKPTQCYTNLHTSLNIALGRAGPSYRNYKSMPLRDSLFFPFCLGESFTQTTNSSSKPHLPGFGGRRKHTEEVIRGVESDEHIAITHSKEDWQTARSPRCQAVRGAATCRGGDA